LNLKILLNTALARQQFFSRFLTRRLTFLSSTGEELTGGTSFPPLISVSQRGKNGENYLFYLKIIAFLSCLFCLFVPSDTEIE
jgi:hypothetical protein